MRQYILLTDTTVSVTPPIGVRGIRLMADRYNASAYAIGHQKAGQTTLTLFCGEGTKQMNVSVSSLQQYGVRF